MKTILLFVAVITVILAGCWVRGALDCQERAYLAHNDTGSCWVLPSLPLVGVSFLVTIGYVLITAPVLYLCAYLIVKVPHWSENRQEEREAECHKNVRTL